MLLLQKHTQTLHNQTVEALKAENAERDASVSQLQAKLQQAEADEVLHHLATDYRLMLASVDRALAERRRTLRELQRETKRHSGAKVDGLVRLRILCRTMMRRSSELPRLTSIRRARP